MTTLETVWHGATWREAEPPVVMRSTPREISSEPIGARVMALMSDGQQRRQADIRRDLRKGYATVRDTVQALVDAGRLERTRTYRDIWYRVVR